MSAEQVSGDCLDEDVSIADIKRWGVVQYKHSKHVLKGIKGLIRMSEGKQWRKDGHESHDPLKNEGSTQ